MIYKLKENIPHDTAFIYVDESSKSVKEYQGENCKIRQSSSIV
jgi:hypothetical protein